MPKNRDYKGDWIEVDNIPRASAKLTESQTAQRMIDAAEREERRLARRAEVKAQIAVAVANETRANELRARLDGIAAEIAATQRLVDQHEAAIAQAADAEELLDAQAALAEKITRLRSHREAVMRSYLDVAKDSCASVYVGELHSLSRPDLAAAQQFSRDSRAACERRIESLHELRGRLTNEQFKSRMTLLIAERTRCETELRDAAKAAIDE